MACSLLSAIVRQKMINIISFILALAVTVIIMLMITVALWHLIVWMFPYIIAAAAVIAAIVFIARLAEKRRRKNTGKNIPEENHPTPVNIAPRFAPTPRREINWQSLTLKEKRREWDRIDRRRERYRKYLQSERWARKRRKVLKRDGHKCVHCGERASQVHHTQYAEKIGTEPIEWLETICSECHRGLHGRDKDEWDGEMDILIDEKINRKRDGDSEYD